MAHSIEKAKFKAEEIKPWHGIEKPILPLPTAEEIIERVK